MVTIIPKLIAWRTDKLGTRSGIEDGPIARLDVDSPLGDESTYATFGFEINEAQEVDVVVPDDSQLGTLRRWDGTDVLLVDRSGLDILLEMATRGLDDLAAGFQSDDGVDLTGTDEEVAPRIAEMRDNPSFFYHEADDALAAAVKFRVACSLIDSLTSKKEA